MRFKVSHRARDKRVLKYDQHGDVVEVERDIDDRCGASAVPARQLALDGFALPAVQP